MRKETADILSFLDSYMQSTSEGMAQHIAHDFKKRRIEKDITRKELAKESGVAISNIARFEQKGLISLKNLIEIATVLGYLTEIKNLFAEPKFSTTEELQQIRKNSRRTKAYHANPTPDIPLRMTENEKDYQDNG